MKKIIAIAVLAFSFSLAEAGIARFVGKQVFKGGKFVVKVAKGTPSATKDGVVVGAKGVGKGTKEAAKFAYKVAW